MAEAKKKENVFERIARWFREMRSELKKVSWPSKEQVVKNTLIVIACTIVVGIIIWLFDIGADLIYNGIISLVRLIKG
ncbi:MAG: preprotein translocase subunit SecE [Oscillospiraceae bacterium]|nr:preprotein translocase subunit SecE [Oscillospiraceae bacterium]